MERPLFSLAKHQLPNDSFIAALTRLVGNERAFLAFAQATQDSRLTEETWQLVLRKELLLLNHWAFRRILCCAKHANKRGASHVRGPNRVLSLLPSTGPAIHLIRRGVPFAAVGIPTSCAFPLKAKFDKVKSVRSVALALGVEKWLTLSKDSPTDAVAAVRKGDLIVVTGKQKSFSTVAAKAKEATCLGSCGRCAVVLGPSHLEVAKIMKDLGANQVANSCTRVRAGFVFHGKGRDRRLVRGLGEQPWVGELRLVLQRLRPSVVIRILSGKRKHSTEMLCGYRVLYSDTRGHVEDSHGFAADPICGWPGDYLF